MIIQPYVLHPLPERLNNKTMNIQKTFKHIFRSFYKWVTATRLRKVLCLTLAALVVLTSIRFIFLKPKEVLADSLFSLNEGYGTTTNDTNGAISAGTISGALWRTDDLCKDEKCLFFDGTQDYVSFSDDIDLDFSATNDFTVSGWFRHVPKSSGTDILVGKMNSADNDGGYQVQMESDGDITCEIDDDDADTTIDDSATSTAASYDDNLWHQFACVKSGTTSLTLYIDGVQVAQDPSISQSTTLANDDPFTIGIDGDVTSNDYTGFIDEVKVVRSAKTAVQIATDYLGSGISTTGSGPVAYWKLDEAGDATRNDSSGNGNNLTESASDTIAQATGKYDYAADFERADTEYLEVADNSSLDLGTSFTLSAWMNVESTAGTYEAAIIKGTTNGTWSYALGTASSNTLGVMIDNDGFAGGGVGITTASSFITSGVWTHITVTYNGSYVRIYKNGVEQVSNDFPYATTITPFNSSGALRLGFWESQAEYYDGLLDEVRIYNYTRSQTQILEDMVANPPSGISASFEPNQSFLSDGLVAYWKMEEAGDATRDDSSGNGNTLSESTADTINQVTGKFGYAGDFELGDTEYLEVSDNPSISAGNVDMTITAWVKAESIDPGSNMLIYKGGIANSTREYHINIDNSDDWRFGWNPGGDVASTEISFPTTIATGTWYFITAYHNSRNGEVGFSVNGSAFVTGTVVGGNDASSSLRIGADQNGAGNWDGLIDEVRIYKRVLSPAEVAKLYAWAPGPLGHWKLDENTGTTTVNDSSGNGIPLTMDTGLVGDWVPGKYGSALEFDQTTSDNLSNTANAELDDLPNTDMTVSLWFKWNNPTIETADVPIAKRGGTVAGWRFEFSESGNYVDFITDCNTVDGTYKSSNSTIPTYTWTHLAVAWNSSAGTAKIYINGAETTYQSTTACTGGYQSDAANTFYIGRDNESLQAWPGYIDDVKIYRYARTSSQIVEDMNGGHPAPGSPIGSAVGYWKFDEGYSTTAYDSNQSTGGAENLTLSSATSAWSNSGKFGKAFYANGARWATIADDNDLDFTASEDITISLWINSTIASAGNPSATEYIINKPPSGATNGGYAVYANTSGQICFGIDDDNTSFPEDSVCTSSDVYDNTWHNIVAVKSGTSRLDMYLDGKANGTPDTSISSTTNTLENTSTLIVASQDTTDDTDDFNGYVDEMQIFRSAFTSDQVKVELNRGFSQSMGSLSTDSTGTASNSDIDAYCPPGQGSSCTGPVAHWKLDENTGTTANDITANGATGTLDSSVTWGLGKYGTSANFNGVSGSGKITTSASTSLDNIDVITIEAWIYPRTFGASDFGRIWHKDSSGGTLHRQFLIDAEGGSGNTNCLRWHQSFSGGNQQWTTDNNTISTNTWQHVAVTYDRTSGSNNPSIYINGVLQTISTISSVPTGTPNSDSANTVTIGNNGAAGTRTFDGFIDDIRVYNYARTPAQIAWDMNRGRPVGWWKLDEGSGTTANDSSGLGNSGTLTNTPTWTTGKFNNAVNFAGSNQHITRADDSDFDFIASTPFSVSAWFKHSAASATETILTKLESTGTDGGYKLKMESDGDITCETDDDDADTTIDDTATTTLATYDDNSWHHVACVYDTTNTDLLIYIDGVLAASDTTTTTNSLDNNDALFIGIESATGTEDWIGDLDDVRIFRYPLTLQQIRAVINEGATTRFGPSTGNP